MFDDPKFWLTISFIVFIILMAKYVLPLIIKMIDNKKWQVTDSIIQARKMKEKAEEFLREAEEYHQKSIAYSQQLIDDAKVEAKSLINDSKIMVKEELARKIILSKQRIEQEEENAIRTVKNKIIALAIEDVKYNVVKSKDKRSLKSTMDKAIVDVSKLIH